MDLILAGLSFVHALFYLDDIVVFSHDPATHIDHLIEVFLLLRDANLKLNPKKCLFMSKEIRFLGFKINENGIYPDEAKIEKVTNWPVPRNLTETRGFVGLASFYKKFIRNFSYIARPLTLLTRKNQPFIWTTECQNAFNLLKQKLTSPPF